MLYVGIDWAQAEHAVCLLDEQGQVLASRSIPDTSAGFTLLQALCATYTTDPGQVIVGIETDHGLLVRALVAAGYRLYAINPKAASRYRERHSVSGAKSDRADARLLADVVRTDRARHRLLAHDSAQVTALVHLTRMHKRLIWDQQRYANQLRDTLRDYYPAALDAVGRDLTSPVALAVLRRAPTPERGRKLSRRQLVGLLRRAGAERRLEERAQTLWEALHATQQEQPAVVADALGTATGSLVALLTSCAKQIATLEATLTEQFKAHPDAELIRSLPGLGAILGARVLAEFGDDPTGYADSRARKCAAGTAPITRASGKRQTVGRRRATNTWLLDGCMRWAFVSLQQSPGARAYYDELRARGKGHYPALRALANRWVGILHGCLRARRPYDEATAWPDVTLVAETTKLQTTPEKPSKKPGSDRSSIPTIPHSA